MKNKSMSRRKLNTIFLFVIAGLYSFISIGYSALQQDVSISGDVNYLYNSKKLYDVLKRTAEETYYVNTYTGTHQDSPTGTGNEDIYYWRASSAATNIANIILDKWNVIFAGHCWQVYRTTDTGGSKMIYNGVAVDGKCNNTGADQAIGSSSFNAGDNSLSDFGYMYNTRYPYSTKSMLSDTTQYVFGNSFTYSNGMYTLTNTKSLSGTWSNDYNTLDNHHYTCFTTGTTCSEVYYVYSTVKALDVYDIKDIHYITLANGKSVNDALDEMMYGNNVNTTNSTIKTMIDNWYVNNLLLYANKIEDVVYCNNRSATNMAGWNPDGGSNNSNISFKAYTITTDSSESFVCANETDQFSVSNNKAKLMYPIGLPTAGEMNILGNDLLRKIGNNYWLASPYGAGYHANTNAMQFRMHYVNSSGAISFSSARLSLYVRPVITLKAGVKYSSGDGSRDNPYIVAN